MRQRVDQGAKFCIRPIGEVAAKVHDPRQMIHQPRGQVVGKLCRQVAAAIGLALAAQLGQQITVWQQVHRDRRAFGPVA